MTWLTTLFIIAVVAETATRFYLSTRQIAAVTANRDRVPEPFRAEIAIADQQKAADYTATRARLGRLQTLMEAVLTLAFTLGGGIALYDDFWRGTGLNQPWLGTAVVLSVLGTMMIIGLPFSIYRTFKIEARFGFNRITPALFVSDLAKRTLLGLVLAGPLLLIAITLMEKAGNAWWLWLWGVWTVATIGLSWAYPRFIAPLFNRFNPLADEALNARIGALLTRCGFSSNGVFVMDGSRRSAHGNAYFTGVGRNKRIVFFDTLMERLGGAEIEAVLAHELGHFRLAHVKQRLVLSMVGSLVGLAILAWFAQQPWFYTALGVPTPSTHAALLLFMLVTPAFTYFATPLSAWWSRRHEFQADDFAIAHADRAALADALVKLYRDNASTLTPDPVHSAFYDSHPPALIRIARLRTSA
jgi:STE24 endopeptidase